MKTTADQNIRTHSTAAASLWAPSTLASTVDVFNRSSGYCRTVMAKHVLAAAEACSGATPGQFTSAIEAASKIVKG